MYWAAGCQCLARYYEETAQPAEAPRWRKELEARKAVDNEN
jgi:hypothetical protein